MLAKEKEGRGDGAPRPAGKQLGVVEKGTTVVVEDKGMRWTFSRKISCGKKAVDELQEMEATEIILIPKIT